MSREKVNDLGFRLALSLVVLGTTNLEKQSLTFEQIEHAQKVWFDFGSFIERELNRHVGEANNAHYTPA